MGFRSTILALLFLGITSSLVFATDRHIEGWGQFKAGMSLDDVKKLLGPPDNTSDSKDQLDVSELVYTGRVRVGNDAHNVNISFYREKAFKFLFTYAGKLSTVPECVNSGEALVDTFTVLYGRPDGTIANIQEKRINSTWVSPEGSVVSAATAWSNDNCNHSIVLKYPSFEMQLSPVILPRQ